MSNRNTWRLFRTLIDPGQTRTETQKHLQRAIHAFDGDTAKMAEVLRAKYLCMHQDSRGSAYSYAGSENTELDCPFQLHDLKAALAKMNRGTAPGRDKVEPKFLPYLSQYLVEAWLFVRVGRFASRQAIPGSYTRSSGEQIGSPLP
ncbi:hypothetical protein HPB49_012157 [Dermacentor silvarum]|uniref:Uncharacterized protein n=1 Tax=Dermacentor silvarum TaxID=543639 RepID=A0ACB8CR51_DERSI|nr:hypothetical protein HPB49_012157 [Dermacentor silvarum]